MGEKKLCYGCMEMKPEAERVCQFCGHAEDAPYDLNYMAPGTVLNERYAIGIKLGHNSEGATYIGYNKSIGCKVLIREYMPQGLCVRVRGKATISVNPNQVVQYKALMAEFTELNKALAQMRNLSHINPTLDLFAANNTTYAVYEYLEGIKLVDFLKDNAGELTWRQVSAMFPPFFTTLSLMHNSGVVHRAISPDTVYVTEKGELRLCGFSISTVRTVHTELPCEIFHGYAAPEQYNPTARQGTWTDVYGICAVLYRILTGCKPTDAPSRMENDNLCAPHEMNPSVPRNVSQVIMRGMSLFSEDRIQTVTELVTQLFEHTEDAIPVPPPVRSHVNQPQRQRNVTQRRVPEEEPRRRHNDYDDYDVDGRESVIDRIKIPIIIGVLLTCVLLVVAIVAASHLNMGPFSGNNSSRPIETTSSFAETMDNIVTEAPSETETETTIQADSNMPDLIGKDFETKKAQFESDGWIFLEATYEFSDEFKAGQIMDQSVKPGEPFASGDTIQVVVSKGPASVEIPDYKGKTLKQYEAELDALGLSEFYVTEAVTNYDYENGEVIELNKEVGDKFDLTGTETLKIYYASNPETEPPTTTTAAPTTPAPTTEPPTQAPTDPPATDPPATEPPATDPPAPAE